MHVFALLLHVEAFRLEQQRLHSFFRKELDKRAVLRKSVVGTEKLVGAMRSFFFRSVRICQNLLRFSKTLCNKTFLFFVQPNDVWLKLHKFLIFASWRRTTDNQRSTGIVDQNGVNLVDDGIVMLALNELIRVAGHIVAQVVETEFVVGTVSDVGVVSRATFRRIRLMLVDAVACQAEEVINCAHPLGVTFGQVIVDGNNVNATSCESVEVNR